MSKTGLDVIKRFEGFSPTVYICPAGYPTIGYGHLVKPHERERFARGITAEQAESLLRQDVQTAEHAVLRLISSMLWFPSLSTSVRVPCNAQPCGGISIAAIMPPCQRSLGNGSGLGEGSWRGW
jgi:hypothetical protein